MTSIVRSRIGTGRSKLAVSRDRCVSPVLSAAFSMARHISAIGGPACWWSGCHGPRVNVLGRKELPSNAVYALAGTDSEVIFDSRPELVTSLSPGLHSAELDRSKVGARKSRLLLVLIIASVQ